MTVVEIRNEEGEYKEIDCTIGGIDFCSSFYDTTQSVEHLAKSFDRLSSFHGSFTCDNRSLASWWDAVKKYDRKTYDNLSLSEKVKTKRLTRDAF